MSKVDLADIFDDHISDAVQQRRAQVACLGQENGQLGDVAPGDLVLHPPKRHHGFLQQHLIEPLSGDVPELLQEQVQALGGLEAAVTAAVQGLQLTYVLAGRAVSVGRVVLHPLSDGHGNGVQVVKVTLRENRVHLGHHDVIGSRVRQHGQHPAQHGHLVWEHGVLKKPGIEQSDDVIIITNGL